MGRRGYFTMEMGLRLRRIRQSHNLSMDTVAGRMGLNGPSRYTMLTRLETGITSDPRLSTIAAYLAACGAKWTDFVDTLDKVEVVLPHKPAAEVPVTPEDAAKVREAVQARMDGIPLVQPEAPTPANPVPGDPAERILREVQAETDKYQRHTANPLKGKAPRKASLAKATEAFQQYSLQAKVIRRKVLEFLCTTPLMTIYYQQHQVLGLMFHKAIRRAAKVANPERREFRLAQGMNEALAYARKFEIKPEYAETIKGIVMTVFESWQAKPPTADR